MADSPTRQRDNPRAEAAFLDYVSLGPSRSLEALRDRYQSVSKPRPTKRLQTLKDWSVRYNWQARIAEALSERAMQLLSQASELDVETFLATSREYHRRTSADMIEAMKLDALHPIRDRVKRAAAQSANLTINVAIINEAERLAAELGITADELLADAERIASAAWGDE